MSAVAALKGYRTQFLYSLHYILSNFSNDLVFRLEGEEDLDILDSNRQLLYAIQLKNLTKPLTLSDILSDKRTSFVKRFLASYSAAIPVLVSYGEISQSLKNYKEYKDTVNESEKTILKKYNITVDDWKLVKSKIQLEEINEKKIAEEVEKMMKTNFPLIDPIPTIGFLLNWLQHTAEKQQLITTKDFYNKVEDFGKYLTERIAIHDQYGLALKPLHKISIENLNIGLLETEFYNATSTRYEHILLGLDVNRKLHLEQINTALRETNAVIVKGASGQGKTALVFSFINQYYNDRLSFELNIQQDPINSLRSIQAIASISKSLDVPAVFVINVKPNSTDWLQIVKESSHLKHILFLIAIRNEDWYRATAVGVEFEHKEIDLALSKQEAGDIYHRLNERSKINHYTDFEEGWIKLGNDPPLLEFVYSITQGDSLHNKLKQQVHQIISEGGLTNNPQIDFLKIVSLADSLGARIDISKLDANIDYQFIIEKLENEYLIKKTSDRKFIQGLHMVRSQTLIEILFGDFSERKEQYTFKCISLIAEEDLYLFLLQVFHLGIITPNQLISKLHQVAVESWSIYAAIIKAYIWAGIRDYVESNRNVMDECREAFGDAWTMLLDFTFASSFDKNNLLDLLHVEEERKEKIKELNTRLQPKTKVFKLASDVINKLIYPQKTPLSGFEWKSFGEALFWLKNIDNCKHVIPAFSESDYESAFKILDSKSLSKLMLGMHTYSPELNAIRKQYAPFFVDKLKSELDIHHVSVDDNEVLVHYIIDVQKKEDTRSSNNFAVTILDILRTAFPDKKRFNSQGHGHRLQTLSLSHDETHKSISLENLPLEEWVNINSTIINLYEYKDRPADWSEYRAQLNKWEVLVQGKIEEINKSFQQLFQERKTYAPIVPIMQNAFLHKTKKIKEPKSIKDPLGIYGRIKPERIAENENEKKTITLYSKYDKFFKCLSDFTFNIDLFITQAGQTAFSKIKLKNSEKHIHDENIERLSQINLYNAIEKLIAYNHQYKSTFVNLDTNHTTKVEVNSLLTTATYWKAFLNDNSKGKYSFTKVLGLKSDFENRIIKDFKQASKINLFSIKYIRSTATNDKPLICIDSESPLGALLGMKEAYSLVQKAINHPEYTSLKYLMLQLWFSNFYFVQTIQKRSINNQWLEVRLYTIKDRSIDELASFNLMPQPIDSRVLENLKLETWTQLITAFHGVNKAAESFGKLVLFLDHLYDLRFLDELELDQTEQEKINIHVDNVGLELQQSYQIILNFYINIFNAFPFDKTTYLESEEEQLYWKALIDIKDNIFPQLDSEEINNQFIINMETIPEWVDKLKTCLESWTIFLFILYGKYINKHSTQVVNRV
ncbi:hypothetical protein [Rufibacter tibetensis]|uniref:Uncharacterized protein n=1 Tax=Rufibacter tibetensis TaxID=512763 RepID=A0A0P0C5P1_9BACT|nr:hypothetical protein [Rufibacter tibetensis]ALI98577.1 hypothetical protein DC20_05830 [Rufibacter tibetensis]